MKKQFYRRLKEKGLTVKVFSVFIFLLTMIAIEVPSTTFASCTEGYNDFPNGSYTFYVKAKDEAGNVDPSPASRSFTNVYDGLEFEFEHRYPISENIGGIGMSPDDSILYVAYWTDTSSDKVEWYFTEEPYNLIDDVAYGRCHGDVVVSGNNQYIFTPTYYSSNVSRFDLWNNKAQTTLPTTSWPARIAMTPDRSKMLVLSGMDGRDYDMGNDAVHIFDISNGNFSEIATVNLSDEPAGYKMAFTDDGAYVYFVTRRKWDSGPAKLHEVSLSSFTITNSASLPSQTCIGIAVAYDKLYVSDQDNSMIRVYNRETLTEIETPPWPLFLSNKPGTLAIPPNKSGLYVLLPEASGGGALEVLDLSTGDKISGYDELGCIGATDIEFNSDGSKVYISGSSGGALVLTVTAVTKKVPVVIVPGIMGSFSNCLFNPACCDPSNCGEPECNVNWDPFGPININLACNWVLDPIDFIGYDPTYESLLQAFRDAGYVDGVTLFPVPYDWRNRNQDTAIEFLEAAIESAKQASGHTQVDIVAHSMGGLVTRWYIEGMDRSDIRKFVMLGTPNHGSAKAYFPWEGGNFSVYSYFERAWFIEPMIEDMKVGYGYEELSDREFVQEMIPSVRQLLPVYDYIYNLDTGSWITVDNMIWRNDLIPYLNYNILVSNLEISNIAIGTGTGQKTLWAIAVHNSTGPDWVDGIPHYLPPNEASGEYKTIGDNTVLTGSAKLGSIIGKKVEGKHRDLPHICKDEVVDFILEQQTQAVEATEESIVLIEQKDTFSIESLLFIGTRSNILMGLTSKEGYRVGRFANMAEKVAEIENYYYRGNEQRTPALGMYNPSAGEYVLSITTKEPMVEYEIYISQSDKKKGKKQKTKVRGILRQNEIKKHVIRINEKLEAF